MKTIMFDFDGTLTNKVPNIWKKIWRLLGYDTSNEGTVYRKQFNDYLNGVTTFKEWVNETCKSWVERGFNKSMIPGVVSDITLMDGFDEFMKTLKEKDIALHVVSGNFVEVIMHVLKERSKYFDTINANNMIFNTDGDLTQIVGTNYDFDGKAKFIADYCRVFNINPEDACFIGNGDNDEWAHQSGCKTICINPHNTDGEDTTKWHQTINTNNLMDLIPLLFDDEKK